METTDNFEEQLRKARQEGFASGFKMAHSAATQQRAIGYLTHHHDMLDIIEDNLMISGLELINELSPILSIRAQTKNYCHPTATKSDPDENKR